MGNTYEVHGYRAVRDGVEVYEWECFYAGESLEDALSALWSVDESTYGCVKLEWRR